MAARVQESFQQAGWLVELPARRASALVGDPLPRLLEVAVLVVLIGPPFVAVAVHGRVEILHLDRDESLRAQQKVVDLTTAVTVAAQQRPVITQGPAEGRRDLGLALHSGLDDLFLIRDLPGRHRRPGNGALLAPHDQDVAQPRQPAALSTSLIPRLPRFLDPRPMLRDRILVLGSRSLLAAQPWPGCRLEHRPGMVGQLDYPHDTAASVLACFGQNSAMPSIAANHKRPHSSSLLW